MRCAAYLLTSALDTYLSRWLPNRMNDVMKRLTVVTTIFMPISFLAGVGGMNFYRYRLAQTWHLPLVALMVVSPVLMEMLYFKNKQWL